MYQMYFGTINNIKKIIKYAHKKGAIVIVDASQSIPHMKIDVQDFDSDFLVFSRSQDVGTIRNWCIIWKKRNIK